MLLYEWYDHMRFAAKALFYRLKPDKQEPEPEPEVPSYESLLEQGKLELKLGQPHLALSSGIRSIEINRNNAKLTPETEHLIDKLFSSEIDGYDALLLVGKAAVELYGRCYDSSFYNQAYRALDRVSDAESFPRFQIDAYLSLAQLAIEYAREQDADYEQEIIEEDGQSKRVEAQEHLAFAEGMMKRLNINDIRLEERVEKLESELQP